MFRLRRSVDSATLSSSPGSSCWSGAATGNLLQLSLNFYLQFSWKRLQLPANKHQLPPQAPCIITSEILEVVRDRPQFILSGSRLSSQAHFVLAVPHLTTSLSPQLLALFTIRPAPDTEATPYGGYSTSYHSCVRSNLYDKLLSLHHSERFCFSPQTLTDPGAKTCSMPLPRASQKCSPWGFHFCFFSGTWEFHFLYYWLVYVFTKIYSFIEKLNLFVVGTSLGSLRCTTLSENDVLSSWPILTPPAVLL